jgi:hypothetical protein
MMAAKMWNQRTLRLSHSRIAEVIAEVLAKFSGAAPFFD